MPNSESIIPNSDEFKIWKKALLTHPKFGSGQSLSYSGESLSDQGWIDLWKISGPDPI
jgi:hypothetical protein